MRRFAKEELELEFNEKTQIFPIRNGVEYLGWHIYLSETGKVIKKVRRQTKIRYKRYIKHIEYAYTNNLISKDEIQQTVSSYKAHLSFGHTYKLQKKADDKINSLLNKYI